MYLTRTLCFLICTFPQVSQLSELCSLNAIAHFNWAIVLFPLSVNMTSMHFPSFCTLRLNGARLFPAAFYFGSFLLMLLYALFSYLVIDISEEFAFRAFQRGIICHISVSLKSLAIVFKCVHKTQNPPFLLLEGLEPCRRIVAFTEAGALIRTAGLSGLVVIRSSLDHPIRSLQEYAPLLCCRCLFDGGSRLPFTP